MTTEPSDGEPADPRSLHSRNGLVFFKQVSAQHPGAAGPPDLERWKEVPA